MILKLEIISGGRKGLKKEFQQDYVKIGRQHTHTETTNDLAFDHATDTRASRDHCEIKNENGIFYLHETSAKNRTFVNGTQTKKQPLKSGDIIQCGIDGPEIKVVISDESAAHAGAAPVPASEKHHAPVVPAPGEKIEKTYIAEEDKAGAKPDKDLVGRNTAWNMIVNAVKSSEKKVEGAIKTSSEGLNKKIRIITAGTAAVFIIFGTIFYLKYSELKESDEMMSECFNRTVEDLNRQIEELKQKGDANRYRLVRFKKDLARMKNSLNDMSGAVAEIRKAVVRIIHNFDVLQADTGKSVIVAGRDFPARLKIQGSGFCVNPEGYIITNAHIVRPWKFNRGLKEKGLTGKKHSIKVTFTGESEALDAEIVKVDEKSDLAVLKVNKSGCPVIIPEEERASAGRPVVILGYPAVVEDAGTKAECMALAGSISRVDENGRVFYSVMTHEGNSGGPVINGAGRLVAVHSSGLYFDRGSYYVPQGIMVMAEDGSSFAKDGEIVSAEKGESIVVPDLSSVVESDPSKSLKNINTGVDIQSVKDFLSEFI